MNYLNEGTNESIISAVPSPPTAPLEIRSIGPNSIIIEWGTPESDGGAPLEGYTIAIRDKTKTMWMQVGKVTADVQKLTIKDLQVNNTLSTLFDVFFNSSVVSI